MYFINIKYTEQTNNARFNNKKKFNSFVKSKKLITQTWSPDSGSVILREYIVLLIW